jgi:hypothetical protein
MKTDKKQSVIVAQFIKLIFGRRYSEPSHGVYWITLIKL